MSEYYVFYKGTRLVVEAATEEEAVAKGVEYLGASSPESVMAHLVETFDHFRNAARARAKSALDFAGDWGNAPIGA